VIARQREARDRAIDLTILRCPICHGSVEEPPFRCSNQYCDASDGYRMSAGQPVLIDFVKSIFTPDIFDRGPGQVLDRTSTGSPVGRFLRRVTYGNSAAARTICSRFMRELLAETERPIVLIIGGGTIGEGMQPLYDWPEIRIMGVDAYASPQTSLVCDAHDLPFTDETFDGVIIQAVLEHVLDPVRVVSEIHRVLKPNAVVLADTPFMQQVHEGAYDFTRFTLNGHRWLFRSFSEVDRGITAGPSIVLLWSIAYLARAVGAGPRLTAAITALFSWVRLFDRVADRDLCADGASGTYFIGRRSDDSLKPSDMPTLYRTAQGRIESDS
jgi:SAM-dependent methyltransferase